MCNLFRNNYWRIQNTNCLSHKVATTHTAGKLMPDKEKEGQMFSKKSFQTKQWQPVPWVHKTFLQQADTGWGLYHIISYFCSCTPEKKAIGRVQGGSEEAPKEASNGKRFTVCEIIPFGTSVLKSRKRPYSLQDGPSMNLTSWYSHP